MADQENKPYIHTPTPYPKGLVEDESLPVNHSYNDPRKRHSAAKLQKKEELEAKYTAEAESKKKQVKQPTSQHQASQQQQQPKTLAEQQQAKAMRREQATNEQDIAAFRKTERLFKFTSLEDAAEEMDDAPKLSKRQSKAILLREREESRLRNEEKKREAERQEKVKENVKSAGDALGGLGLE